MYETVINIGIIFMGLALGILTLNIIVDTIDMIRCGQQKKTKKFDDHNVTFKNGISLEKKQYPSMKDDFRESVEIIKKEDDGNQDK